MAWFKRLRIWWLCTFLQAHDWRWIPGRRLVSGIPLGAFLAPLGDFDCTRWAWCARCGKEEAIPYKIGT
jgi:hypothetical protein